MKRVLLLMALVQISVALHAEVVNIDGIWYDLIKKAGIATVEDNPYSQYTGDVVIPGTVEYEGMRYEVTEIADEFVWKHFVYGPLDNQPGCAELRGLYRWYSDLEDYSDLTIYKQDEARSILTAFIPETVFDENQEKFTLVSVWGEGFPFDPFNMNRTGAFQGWLVPDTIYLPKTIVWIGQYAFYGSGTENLKRVYLSEGIEHIGDYAFANNIKLDSVVLPKSLKQVSNGIFSGCKSLKSLTLPDRAESIGHYAFDGCTSLECIDLPSTVRSIGEYAFCGTPLRSITLPFDCTIGKGVFKDCSQLEKIQLPTGLTELPEESFLNCKLPTINLPASLQTIGKNAFGSCELSEIDLPQGLLSIGECAFDGCDYLRKITVRGSEPPAVADKNAFSNYNAILYVPQGSIDKYATSPVWSLFRDILPIEEKPVWHNVSFALPSGCIEQEVPEGEKLTLRFAPDDGYRIHSVTYNGSDVTELLDSDNLFTTPTINSDAKVAVVFEKIPDGIVMMESSSGMRVQVGNRQISISGATSKEVLQLYNAEGQLVKTIQADADGVATLTVSKKGLYIVSSADKNFKLRI